jgi:hypothetical protein
MKKGRRVSVVPNCDHLLGLFPSTTKPAWTDSALLPYLSGGRTGSVLGKLPRIRGCLVSRHHGSRWRLDYGRETLPDHPGQPAPMGHNKTGTGSFSIHFSPPREFPLGPLIFGLCGFKINITLSRLKKQVKILTTSKLYATLLAH